MYVPTARRPYNSSNMQTPIRWAGSKSRTLSRLRPYWSTNYGRYIEPFAGSACLFFDVEPSTAVLGDLNEQLIRTYRALRDDLTKVIGFLSKLKPSEDEYYRQRSIDPATLSNSRAAARFLFLNKYCFNGLYRTNKAGKFNVPYGHLRKNESINPTLLMKASERLRGTKLLHGDFEQTLDHARCGDFVYLDPPYVSSDAGSFSEYLPNSFAPPDLERLITALHHLDRRGVSFAMSYTNDRKLKTELAHWKVTTIKVRRNIAGFTGSRKIANEIVVSNVRSTWN